MESAGLADELAENVPEVAVDATDKQGEEVAATPSAAVTVVDLTQHYSLADSAPPPRGCRKGRSPKIRVQESQLDRHGLCFD